jgi:hypothetical protein
VTDVAPVDPAKQARRRKVRLIAAGLGSLFALAAAEVGLRIKHVRRADARERDSWHEVDEWLGWRNKAGWKGEGSTAVAPVATFSVRTNARGQRDDREVGDAAPAGVKRVAFIGEATPRRLEEELARRGKRVEVLNLGTCAWGVDQMRLAVERQALPLKPDLIIIGVITDDFRRALRAVSNTGHRKPRYVLEGAGSVRLVGAPVPPPPPPGAWIQDDFPPDGGSFLAWQLGQVAERVGVAVGGEQRRLRWRLGQAILRDAARAAAPTPLVVALFPMPRGLDGPEPARDVVAGLEPEVPVIDLHEPFRQARAGMTLVSPLFLADEHPTVVGHRVAAAAIADGLEARGLLR